MSGSFYFYYWKKQENGKSRKKPLILLLPKTLLKMRSDVSYLWHNKQKLVDPTFVPFTEEEEFDPKVVKARIGDSCLVTGFREEVKLRILSGELSNSFN